MKSLVLVDTSSWTQALRRNGNQVVRDRVLSLMGDDRAAWCEPVRLELWKGASSQKDYQTLQQMEVKLVRLPISNEVWNLACQIATTARGAGLPVPTIDIIIFACAQIHRV